MPAAAREGAGKPPFPVNQSQGEAIPVSVLGPTLSPHAHVDRPAAALTRHDSCGLNTQPAALFPLSLRIRPPTMARICIVIALLAAGFAAGQPNRAQQCIPLGGPLVGTCSEEL